MTDKILDYRTVSSPEQARETIKYFENMYHRCYDYGYSYGGVEDAIAVCVLETSMGRRFVTTTTVMRYIESKEVVKTIDVGEL